MSAVESVRAVLPPASGPTGESCGQDPLDAAIDVFVAESSSFLPHLDRVEAACSALRTLRGSWQTPSGAIAFARLFPVLSRRAGAVATAAFGLLEEFASAQADPWTTLARLLAVDDGDLARRALDAVSRAALGGAIDPGNAVLPAIADAVDSVSSSLTGDGELRSIRSILASLTGARGDVETPQSRRAREECLLAGGSTLAIRRLAARLLDLDGELAREDLVRRLLGIDGHGLLAPLLQFTRATHQDLLHARVLVDSPGGLESIRRAEGAWGEAKLREIVAALGWSRMNRGLEIRAMEGVSVAGSFPLVLSQTEAALFDGCPDARRAFDRLVVVAIGGQADDPSEGEAGIDAVTRFRAYNVLHADLLTELLDLAPLTASRTRSMLDTFDRLVSEFGAIFSGNRDEAADLASLYADMKARIELGLARSDGEAVPTDVCRLVQAFEDPVSPRDIRTLHGLKRYLHQRGLKLAFGLVPSGPRATRTVDIAIVSGGRPIEVSRQIEFVDLDEHSAPDRPGALPEAVSLLVDAFAHQLVHGTRKLPSVSAFCYGNEVHYFVRFRNHPAFIRVDYSPPLRGGMIDLQYLGVSNNELAWHPCPSLDAIRQFFERLDYIVEVDSTRIHARYDKERAVGLDDLVRQATRLFSLVPYLMDIDWTIASLQLPPDARRAVASAWSAFFASWDVLPFEQFLTRDGSGILVSRVEGPSGVLEDRWTGDGPYRDRFTVEVPAPAIAHLVERAKALGFLHAEPSLPAALFQQAPFDRTVLAPLRQGLRRGEILEISGGFEPAPPSRFESIHELDQLAAIVDRPPREVADAVRVAKVLAMIERSVRFRATGSINGREVHRAAVPLGGRTLGAFVLRDETGLARLGCAAFEPSLGRRRASADGEWIETSRCGSDVLVELLRRANYLGEGPPPEDDSDVVAAEIRRIVRAPCPRPPLSTMPGERVIRGTAASPGRAAGIARIGTEGRRPEDCAGSVIVTERLEPDDTPFLHASAGIVSTGGGILSHLALVAVEAGRPAVIVAGVWAATPAAGRVLVCPTWTYREEPCRVGGLDVVRYVDVRETEVVIRDGDLLVIDADLGIVRVLARESLAPTVHGTVRIYLDACRALGCAAPDEILEARGRRIHARHQVEKLMPRLGEPALARLAVEELLLGQTVEAHAGGGADLVPLLSRLTANAEVGTFAGQAIAQVCAALSRRLGEARQQALGSIPLARTAHDVLALRLAVVERRQACVPVNSVIEQCGRLSGIVGLGDPTDFDALATDRLARIRERLVEAVSRSGDGDARRRLDGVLGRIDTVLGIPRQPAHAVILEPLAARLVITPRDGGLTLAPLIGGKAANLGETAKILGHQSVPAWFTVTDAAFQAALDCPLRSMARGNGQDSTRATVRTAIETVLSSIGASPERNAEEIQDIWRRAAIPNAVQAEVTRAHRELGAEAVAVRSSGLEEDTERESGAGQFETFLFVRGEQAVLSTLSRVWAGLWNARAIRGRAARRDSRPPHGGVVVQRMVNSRVSGVIQTINAAQSKPLELVINVGLGLGEGVVSGLVAVDHIVVTKPPDQSAPIRFRYAIGDKRSRLVYDERFGQGTVKMDTLAHQRLRAALEYQELVEVVGAALLLEDAYASPLDIEFAFEGPHLNVLQVRPVPSAWSVWQETLERHPLQVRVSVEVAP